MHPPVWTDNEGYGSREPDFPEEWPDREEGKEEEGSEESSSGCAGCFAELLAFLVLLIMFWGLVFGVSYKGDKHYVGCNCSDGLFVVED